jgi:SAM-dependent methyltransferase
MPSNNSYYGPDQGRIHHTRFGDLAADAATLLVERLHGGGLRAGHVTDLGCGSGILCGRLLDAGYSVTGIDISPSMIDLARATAPQGSFSVGPALDADVALSVGVTATGEVLNYATDSRAGLDALAVIAHRVFGALEPGGVFLLDLRPPGATSGRTPATCSTTTTRGRWGCTRRRRIFGSIAAS